MKLSIVTTLYRSSSYIEEFYRKTSESARKLAEIDYEIVFVNDGSPDNSLEMAVRLTKSDSHVVVVNLSRNFGHHRAMMTGLSYAKGEKIFLIDGDLEEDPQWLLSFSQQMERDKCDVVYGVQEKRKGNWFERISGELYYWALDWLLKIKHPRNITTARLMTRSYVEALLLHKEREIVISGLWLLTGFQQNPQIVNKKSTSQTTYNLLRKLSHFVNVVTSFSSRPLISIFFAGTAIFAVSFTYASVLVIKRLFFAIPVDGWTSIMVSVWLLGGLTILFIGVIGIYLSKVFIETKQRPISIVKDTFGDSED